MADHAGRHFRDGARDNPGPSEQEVMLCVSPADEERLHRVALKQETAIDLLNGRLTFDEAVMQFIEISAGDEDPSLRVHGSSLTDRERMIQQVIAHVRSHATHNRGRYDVELARIEAEANAAMPARIETH
jgi:hypothetical protein